MKIKYIGLFFMALMLMGFSARLSAKKDSIEYKRVRVTGMPTVGYNNSFGLQLGALGMMMFDIKRADTISPTSSLIGMGFYTTNNTWFGLLGQRLYWAEDNWRAAWAFGYGNINFQFYAEGLPGTGNGFIDYTTSTRFVYAELTPRVYKRLYIGLGYMRNRMSTTFYLDDIIGVNPDSLKTVSGFGIPLSWDSRDNTFNPSSGLHINMKTLFYKKWVGSDLNYSSLNFDANYYWPINNHAVLASRITVYTGLGEVPFEGLRTVGRDDIRGYSKGEYRGDQIYTIQTEYRHTFSNHFGFVAFLGFAAANNSLSEDTESWSGLLPGLGAGIRYMAIKDKKINLGIDAAVGKGDWGLYFRIGEAF